MVMNRKDDHISEALKQVTAINDFDRVRCVPDALASVDVDAVDISVHALGHTFSSPLYINAMSGGSTRSEDINRKLASLARACDLPMATGSVSAALKDAQWEDSFRVVRDQNPHGFVFANVGLSQSVEGALKAVDLLNANALQIHLNAPQEITMPEGDRAFHHWPQRLQDILGRATVPVVVKEVGFGMSQTTFKRLKALGATTVDVSGRGGTNFIEIENARRTTPLQAFESYGLSTVESLLEGQNSGLTLWASGGVRNAYDVIKALALGAQMVGMSGYFLKLIHDVSLDEAIDTVQTLKQDLQRLCAVLNVTTLSELRQIPLVFDTSLRSFIEQRKL